MKKVCMMVVVLSMLACMLSGCSLRIPRFNELEVGECFGINRDGYFEKIPHNYCIAVDTAEEAVVARVPPECRDVKWDTDWCYDEENIVVRGNFIGCSYTSEYLLLCEQPAKNKIQYVLVYFADEEIQHYAKIEDVYRALGVDSISWESLCTPIQRRSSIRQKDLLFLRPTINPSTLYG